jgi:hypothetical protein
VAWLLAMLSLVGAPVHAAGLLDPLLRFQRIRTAHFVIYFHQGEEPLARRLASLVEDVRAQAASALHSPAPDLTHVILADQAEVANGWATPLPRNTVFLNAAAPAGNDLIGRTDNWLRLVFTHEYTHIVHLDRAGGWARVARGLLGRSPVTFPNLWLPQWQIEGLATWQESALTGAGRLHAGDFLAIERGAAATGHPLALDRASGGLVAWPDGHAAYAAGLGFHAYLADRFGDATLGALADATARRLPFLGSRAFRRVYGASLGTLWRDYTEQVLATVARDEPQPTPQQLTHHGHIVVGPRFAASACPACATQVVYSVQTPDAFPSLRAVDLAGGDSRWLAQRYLGSTAAVTERAVVFDQQELRRDVGLYSDLYVLDRATGDVRALTHGARLQDPDLSPDGLTIAAVRERGGRRDLVVVRLRQRLEAGARDALGEVETILSEADAQYSTPRWSPDGRSIAAERRSLFALPDVVIVDPAQRTIRETVSDPTARIVTPAWRPDGAALVVAADRDGQPFDLYEYQLASDRLLRRLTRTTGAFWPDVSADGRSLVYVGYTAAGSDLFTVPYMRLAQEPPRSLPTAAVSTVGSGSALPPAGGDAGTLRIEPYTPFATLAPTFWTPLLVANSDQTRLGASLVGSDVLWRHAYAVNLTWSASGPSVARSTDTRVPDWNVTYAYTRWRPSFFASASRETLFRSLIDPATTRPIAVAGTQNEWQAGVFLPFVHVRQNSQVLASIVQTQNRYLLPDRTRSATLASTRLALAHDTSQRYGYSISREHGVDIGGTLELARQTLGSDADATTATVDARAYLPGIGLHHVVALRVAGGSSRGSDLARQSFQLGAVMASPSVIDFASDALGLVRGSANTTAGSRLLLANVDYRFPLAKVERGVGTYPLLLRTLHASVFGDVGTVRGGVADDERWRSAVGGELSADGVAGYALPFGVSAGAAWNHDGGQSRGVSVYVRIGRAF